MCFLSVVLQYSVYSRAVKVTDNNNNELTQIPFNGTNFLTGDYHDWLMCAGSVIMTLILFRTSGSDAAVTSWMEAETNLLEQKWVKKRVFLNSKFASKLCQMVLSAGPKLCAFTVNVNWVSTGIRRVSNNTGWHSIQLMQRTLLPLIKGRPRWVVCNRDAWEKYPFKVH